MATITKSWTFDSSSQSWVGTASGTGNGTAWQSSGGQGSPAGCLGNITTGKTHTGAGHWDMIASWETLFGVPAGSIVAQVGGNAGDGHWWKCSVYTTGAASTEGPFELRDSSGATLLGTFSSGQAYSSTTSGATVAASAVSVPSGQQASNTGVTLRLNGAVKTGNSTTANNTLLQDSVTLTATYSFPTLNLSGSPTESPDSTNAAGTVLVRLQGTPAEATDVLSGSAGVAAKFAGSPAEQLDAASGLGTVSAAGVSFTGSVTGQADSASAALALRIKFSGTPAGTADLLAGLGTVSASTGHFSGAAGIADTLAGQLRAAVSLTGTAHGTCAVAGLMKGQFTKTVSDTPDGIIYPVCPACNLPVVNRQDFIAQQDATKHTWQVWHASHLPRTMNLQDQRVFFMDPARAWVLTKGNG